ncbi:hypothetical protein DDE05_00460 [Streptomyces cavourensis]|nr:hypothetical protein DDE05_00460 [Streptomyces cavourensis]
MVRTYSSFTMRLEYQIGPAWVGIKVTGSPFLRPLRGVYTYDSSNALSAPLSTPLVTSPLINDSEQPAACAISFMVQRRTPYSSWSCIRHMMSSQAPRSACVQRRRLLLPVQSPG